jgi:hypothetical protein
MTTTQDDWRFCTKCYTLFWFGGGSPGACSVGGAHSPFESESPTHAGSSWNFELSAVSTAPPPQSPGGGGGVSEPGFQGNWRFCTKCYSLFWWGYDNGGCCPHGAQHSPLESASPTHAGSSWDFELKLASGAGNAGFQGDWRFCTKCYALFFGGYGNDGVCASGGQHSPLQSASPSHAGSSVNFELKVASASPPIRTSLSWNYPKTQFGNNGPLGWEPAKASWSFELAMFADGLAEFSGEFIDEGTIPGFEAPAQNYEAAVVVVTPGGVGFKFSHQKNGVPTGGAKDQWRIGGVDAAVKAHWAALSEPGTIMRADCHVDSDFGSVLENIVHDVEQLAQYVDTAIEWIEVVAAVAAA